MKMERALICTMCKLHGSRTQLADFYFNDNRLSEEDIQNLNADDEVTVGLSFKSRTLFIIGPLYKNRHYIRALFNYPAAVGFSTGEVLRVVDALQTADAEGFVPIFTVQILRYGYMI